MRSKVLEVLDKITPAMQADGGGVELVNIIDGDVHLKFKNTCTFCPSQKLTKQAIEKFLKEELSWVQRIVVVN